MATGTLQYLRPDRGVRSLVANDAGLHRHDSAFCIAADFVRELNWMALRMYVEAFESRERELHRPTDEPGHERGLSLNRHVFLATERTPVAHKLCLYAIALHAED